TASSLSYGAGCDTACSRAASQSPLDPPRARQDFGQGNGPELPDIDADIELPRLRLQSAMAMAVQVDPSFCHAAPAAKGVMAQHEREAINGYLGIGLHAIPARELGRRWGIVVT